MITIDKKLISNLLEQAVANPRLRQNYDLRTSSQEGCQRMLNALVPGTVVPVHRHPRSNESVLLLCGKLIEVIFDNAGNEVERCLLDTAAGNFGCIVPAGAWHTVEVLEPSVIMEVKDGRYGEDGSETFEQSASEKSTEQTTELPEECINSLGDLRKNIEYLVGMERHSGSMEVITPLYVSRMLNVPLEDVEREMAAMEGNSLSNRG